MPVLVIGRLNTRMARSRSASSPASPTTSTRSMSRPGTILWQKHWDYAAPAAARRRRPAAPTPIRRTSGSCGPAAAATRRSSVPPTRRAAGRSISSPATGCCTSLNAADGSDLEPPYMFHIGKGWSLNLVGNVLWMANTYAGDQHLPRCRLDDPRHKVMTFNAGSGGAWGRRGAAIDSSGTAWFTTGDGIYDLTTDPPRYGNSVVGVHMVGRRAEAEELLRAEELGVAAQARSRSEQHADGLHLQGAGADRGVGQGVPHVPARSAVGRRRRQSDAALQERAVLQRGSRLSGRRQLGRAVDLGGSGRQPMDPGAVLGAGALEVQVRGHARPGDGRRRRRLQAARSQRQVRLDAGVGVGAT